MYGIEKKEKAWGRIDKDNQALIIQLVSQRSELFIGFYEYLQNSGMIASDFDVKEVVKFYKPINCG